MVLTGNGPPMRIDSGDLVATAAAGVTLVELDAALAAHNAWVALDPPGSRQQALGDVLAAGSGGPLCAGFGAPRDQVVGLSFIAGTGTAVKTGGRVVKNVAGFDLAKLLVGSHHAFGRITEAHLRLRVRPEADLSAFAAASLDDIARRAAGLMARGVSPAAFEVVCARLAAAMGLGERWALLVRAMGSPVGAAEELAACDMRATEVNWPRWHETTGGWPVVLRLGCDPAGWSELYAITEGILGPLLGASICVPRGFMRLGLASASVDAIGRLRATCAARHHPVTVERATEDTLRRAGIWGSLDPGAMAVTRRLLQAYDPEGTAGVPLFAS